MQLPHAMHTKTTSPSALTSLLTLLFLLSRAHGRTKLFDVTRYGASTKSRDNQQAFLAAWNHACTYAGKATLLVPTGTFVLGTVAFRGPCHGGSSPTVEIRGTLKAIADDPEGLETKWWILFEGLNGLLVLGRGGGTLDGQGARSWPLNTCHHNSSCQVFPTALCFYGVENTTISGLHLKDSKSFHMKIHKSSRVTVRALKITAPELSPNTDGIHVGHSKDVVLSNLDISTGDDCISVGPGTVNLSILTVVCGPGHGISVGSLGKYPDEEDVEGVHVRNCILRNTTNGVRIKTWPGSRRSRVSNLTFEDMVMENVTNPIVIDQHYCPLHNCADEPSHVSIEEVTYRRIGGTSAREVAVSILCSEATPCANVRLEDIALRCVDGSRKCTTMTSASCSNVDGGYYSGFQLPSPCMLLRRMEHSTPEPNPVPAPVPELPPAPAPSCLSCMVPAPAPSPG